MSSTASSSNGKFCIALHGGIEVIPRGVLTDQQEKEIRGALEGALKAGLAFLTSETVPCKCDPNVPNLPKSECACTAALSAVEAAVVALEEFPYFNAGKGAVFAFDGTHELDASIMEGKHRRSGAIGGVKRCRNPIKGARTVMERTPHVFLVGPEADAFLEESGLETVDNTWFDTDLRRRQWMNASAYRSAHEQPKESTNDGSDGSNTSLASPATKKFGTVGAVAVDVHGNVAAATSTGGMTNKRWGRLGDSPVIGAGTWADNRFCAVSATGHGEYFIQNAVAHDISSRVRYLGETVEKACTEVIKVGDLVQDGGEGGVVAIDPKTRSAALVFNSPSMYRAWIDSEGNIRSAIYGDEC